MKGYIYRKTWSYRNCEWSEEQLVSPLPITVTNIKEIVDLFDVRYGRFEICSSQVADVQFILRYSDGYVLDWVFCRELLPWE